MKVICYGDSNTYGYDPRSYFGGRYDPDARWVDLLEQKTGWDIQNLGMNGREIPRNGITIPSDTDLLIVMLGTNDLLQGNAVEAVSNRMEAFLGQMEKSKICLIAPPPMALGEWVPSSTLVDASKALASEYKRIAQRYGIRCLDAGQWDISLTFDGVHFTEEGHIAFAEHLGRELMG